MDRRRTDRDRRHRTSGYSLCIPCGKCISSLEANKRFEQISDENEVIRGERDFTCREGSGHLEPVKSDSLGVSASWERLDRCSEQLDLYKTRALLALDSEQQRSRQLLLQSLALELAGPRLAQLRLPSSFRSLIYYLFPLSIFFSFILVILFLTRHSFTFQCAHTYIIHSNLQSKPYVLKLY